MKKEKLNKDKFNKVLVGLGEGVDKLHSRAFYLAEFTKKPSELKKQQVKYIEQCLTQAHLKFTEVKALLATAGSVLFAEENFKKQKEERAAKEAADAEADKALEAAGKQKYQDNINKVKADRKKKPADKKVEPNS